MYDPLLKQLETALQIFPGVGKRSAQRMVQHILQNNRNGALVLGEVLSKAMQQVGNCKRCRNFSTQEICALCDDASRDQALLCIVASPSDIDAIESADYNGQFFILMGLLSPMRGIGRDNLGLKLLKHRIESTPFNELILALPGTIEGEATSQLIIDQFNEQIKISKLAQGVPVGSDLSYLDSNTLNHAFRGRH